MIKQEDYKISIKGKNGTSKREDMKNLIQIFQKDIPTVRANLYGAIKRSNIKGWESPEKK